MELKRLLELLDRIGEEVTLVVEQRLIGLLSASCPYSTLSKRGVQKIVTLPVSHSLLKNNATSTFLVLSTAIPTALNDIVLFTRANIGSRLIVALMAGETPDATRLFSKAGILGDIELEVLSYDFVPEIGMPGLSTLHLTESISKPELNVDAEWLLAKALHREQVLQGGFARVSGFGDGARRVFEIIKALDNEQSIASQVTDGDEYHYKFSHTFYGGQGVDHLILIDRKVDLATPMLMQATYAGVLSELFSITSAGVVETNNKKYSVRDDHLYSRIANLNFADACQQLHATAKEVQADVNQGSKVGESLGELRQFVATLGSLKETERLINTHVELAGEAMQKFANGSRTSQSFELQSRIMSASLSVRQAIGKISDLIYQSVDLELVLRLVSLVCLARGGIRERQLQVLYDEIARTYGPKATVEIQRMERSGLIFSTSTLPSYITLDKTWSLVASEDEEAAALPYAGIVPLSSRLAAAVVSNSPAVSQASASTSHPSSSFSSSAVSQLLNASNYTIDFFDEATVSDSAREAKLRRILLRNTPGHDKPVVVIGFIGGVTYAEAAATDVAVNEGAKTHQGRDIDVRLFATGVVN